MSERIVVHYGGRCARHHRGLAPGLQYAAAPQLARQILRKVFPGVRPLALAPAEGGGVAFTGSAAGASILAGLANVTMVVRPG